MKIAHVITRLIIGGAQENTILTCEGLRLRGHDVTLIAGPETGPEGSLWPQAEARCGRTVRIDSLCRAVRPADDWRCAGELTEHFRGEGYDVVHTHSSKAGILGRWAAHRAGVPLVVHTIHGMSFNRTQSAPIRALYAFLERRAARWTHAFISVADAMTDQAVGAGIAPRDRFTTIRSGMETDHFAPDAITRAEMHRRWEVPEDAVVIGTVARLFRNKGYEHLLAALPRIVKRCPNAYFVWVGDGAQRAEYTATLEKLNLRSRVHLTGLVRPAEIPAILTGFDVLVHASAWEGLPRAIVQASLTEVPPVSFDNDGAPEAIDPGETGSLAPLGDADALADRVVELASDADLRRRLGQAARRKCMAMFDYHKMVAEIEALYAAGGK
ncbi:MAG TPA: glycosyltransferase family 4 protein [Phycisphaerae bacterium]|nr:glycosyltransferase family 4 protein [Phycisphaerales bacterium]HRX83680.1 glycosyltransferase family 4 protein [Phycisphaerae bacterium]